MHKVVLGTRKQRIGDWIEERGADRGAVLIRLTAGWDLRKALEEPLRPPLRHLSRKKTVPWIGVFKRPDRPGYRVKVGPYGAQIELGTYGCDKEAAAIYNIWARNEYGVSAKINLT